VHGQTEREKKVLTRCEWRDLYQKIRRDYFPRWDLKGEWRFHVQKNLPSLGKADPERKAIRVRPETYFSPAYLLVHEIAHAVTNGSHAVLWRRRMDQAAVRAAKLGEKDLADVIRHEQENYRTSPLIDCHWIYGQIEDWTAEQPGKTFKEIMEAICWDYGMTQREFLRFFPRARKVWEKAHADAVEYQRLEREFHEKHGLPLVRPATSRT
jgi:hypothetical protein